MIRVLHVIPHLTSGGADRVAATLVQHLQKMPSLRVSLCVLNGDCVQGDRSAGIAEFFTLDCNGSLRRPVNLVRAMIDFRKLVNKWQPDIIHSHLWPACRFTATALTGMNIRHVWHAHDTRSWLVESRLASRFYRCWTRLLIKTHNPAIVAVSEAVAGYSAPGLGLEPIDFLVVRNAVDLEEFDQARFKSSLGNEKKIPVIGLAAQFRPEKGHKFLIKACEVMREHDLHFRLRMAGDGQTLDNSRNLVHRLGLADCTEFLGNITDVPRFLSELDIFVLPSTAYEGMPLCILEAMAMGLPVIATDVGGTKEVIIDGQTGLLVPAGDISSLAMAIGRLLQDRRLASQIALEGEGIVKKSFSYNRFVEEVSVLYQRVASCK